MVIELESVKTRISAPAHPSATGIGRVSGLVFHLKEKVVGSSVINYVGNEISHILYDFFSTLGIGSLEYNKTKK